MSTWGPITYPVSLDTFSPVQVDNVDQVIANHPNSLAEAVIAIETKLNLDNLPILGVGGLQFDSTGSASNPGAAGEPTLWIDRSTPVKLWYTDESANDYDILRVRFDLTVAGGTEVTTGTATSGGGTVDFTLVVGVSKGLVHKMRVRAVGNTVNSDIYLYADAGRTDRIWWATGQDCYTSGTPWPYADFRIPFPLTGWGSDLSSGTVYGTIINNGANDSYYIIEISGEGLL